MPKVLVQIRFRHNMTRDDYLTQALTRADEIAAVDGLLWKIWPFNAEERSAGGVYLFDDAASARAYIEGPLVAGLRASTEISDLAIMMSEVAEPPTAITRGPL